MKHKKKCNPFVRTVLFLSVFVLTMILAAIGSFYYVFSIPEPEGLSLASWPNTFTDNFSVWLEQKDGAIRVQEIGLNRLNEYGLWLQILDESGREVFSHYKPEQYPAQYAASELIALRTSAYAQNHTVFVSSFEDAGKTWSYIIGFPYAVGKYMLYYNGAHIARLSPMAKITILSAFGAFVVLILGYGVWLTRKLSKTTGGIRKISHRTYTPLKANGVFSELYGALNQMDTEIRHADQISEETERTRREWIANITHDLKTPLSPVKGYAELLADSGGLDAQAVQEYGTIILKNVNHVEKLMNDLKLTYQLDSGAIPFHPKKLLITRFLKELVIDIVNDPAFASREITFHSALPELTARLDPDLFRRAVQNLIMNALIHNPPDTKVTITVDANPKDGIFILIRDTGAGMSGAEQSALFGRYYRGTNTKEKPEGTGLGLAIAKQIIALHGGGIAVKSNVNEGTAFTITLPFPL